jgi:hypothetical protein
MTRIVVEPLPIVRGLHEKELDLVRRDLEVEGHSVSFRAPIEERSAGGGGAWLPHAYALVLYLAEHVNDHVLNAIVDILIARLVFRRRGSERPVAAIYGPDGRTVLREVPLREEARDE